MFYFILWVVFLVVVILAVPVTLMLEKRQSGAGRSENAGDEEIADEEFVDETGEDASDREMVGDDFGGGDEVADFADAAPAGGDDFSAFEDEFK